MFTTFFFRLPLDKLILSQLKVFECYTLYDSIICVPVFFLNKLSPLFLFVITMSWSTRTEKHKKNYKEKQEQTVFKPIKRVNDFIQKIVCINYSSYIIIAFLTKSFFFNNRKTLFSMCCWNVNRKILANHLRWKYKLDSLTYLRKYITTHN